MTINPWKETWSTCVPMVHLGSGHPPGSEAMERNFDEVVAGACRHHLGGGANPVVTQLGWFLSVYTCGRGNAIGSISFHRIWEMDSIIN